MTFLSVAAERPLDKAPAIFLCSLKAQLGLGVSFFHPSDLWDISPQLPTEEHGESHCFSCCLLGSQARKAHLTNSAWSWSSRSSEGSQVNLGSTQRGPYITEDQPLSNPLLYSSPPQDKTHHAPCWSSTETYSHVHKKCKQRAARDGEKASHLSFKHLEVLHSTVRIAHCT